MSMTDHQAGEIIVNDLASMTHRIEALPAHPSLTQALAEVQNAAKLVREGITALHQTEMRRRFADTNSDAPVKGGAA